jgi:hypothetical protein
MREMEEELKRALARVEPPDGFAERVLARTAVGTRGRHWYMRYGAIAATVALVFSGALAYQRHVEQQRAQDAQKKLVFALHLTAEKLTAINNRLRESSSTVRIGEPTREDL